MINFEFTTKGIEELIQHFRENKADFEKFTNNELTVISNTGKAKLYCVREFCRPESVDRINVVANSLMAVHNIKDNYVDCEMIKKCLIVLLEMYEDKTNWRNNEMQKL